MNEINSVNSVDSILHSTKIMTSGADSSNSSSTSLTFNENLRQLSLALQNKENNANYENTANANNIKRKPRTQITKKQKEILEYAYNMKSYPDSNEVEYLCHILGFEENVIRVSLINSN